MKRIYTHPSGVALTASQHAKLALAAQVFGISASEVIRRFLRPLFDISDLELIVRGQFDAILTKDQTFNALKRDWEAEKARLLGMAPRR